MREKSNKFRKGQGKRKKSVALKKDDISWLSKNTHFDPDTVTEWHKVRKIFRKHNRYVLHISESGAVKWTNGTVFLEGRRGFSIG